MANAEQILADVESRLVASKEQGIVVEAATVALVEERVERRTELMVSALKEVKKLRKELEGIKPAAVGFDEAGNEVPGQTYTKCQVARRKTINERLEKVEQAVADQDYDKLSKLGF